MCVQPESGLVRLLPQADMPEMDCFLVYAEELKNVARVQAFRDFLVAAAQSDGDIRTVSGDALSAPRVERRRTPPATASTEGGPVASAR